MAKKIFFAIKHFFLQFFFGQTKIFFTIFFFFWGRKNFFWGGGTGSRAGSELTRSQSGRRGARAVTQEDCLVAI